MESRPLRSTPSSRSELDAGDEVLSIIMRELPSYAVGQRVSFAIELQLRIRYRLKECSRLVALSRVVSVCCLLSADSEDVVHQCGLGSTLLLLRASHRSCLLAYASKDSHGTLNGCRSKHRLLPEKEGAM